MTTVAWRPDRREWLIVVELLHCAIYLYLPESYSPEWARLYGVECYSGWHHDGGKMAWKKMSNLSRGLRG